MKVRLKVVRSPEIRRAEQDVSNAELEVNELQSQLQEATEKLKQARDRCESLRRKNGKRKDGTPPQGKGVDQSAELAYNSRTFEKDPSKRLVKKSLVLARKLETWDPLSLVGLYLESYEARYFREWKGSLFGLSNLHREMKKLFERVGDEAGDAVVAVFSPKMKWVDNQVGLLLSIDAYERFIVPAIAAGRTDRKGEGSEWTGSRSEVGGCEEVDL
jgi:hypothetical protein